MFFQAKKIIVFTIFILSIVHNMGFSQNNKNKERELNTFFDHMYFGSGLNLMVGGGMSVAEVSPYAGYYFNQRWRASVGGIYTYYSDRYALKSISTHIWGYQVNSDFALIKSLSDVMPVKSNMAIFIEGKYMALYLEKKIFKEPQFSQTGHYLYHTALIGGGIRQPIGKRSAFFIKIYANVNYFSLLPYDNPLLEFGFEF